MKTLMKALLFVTTGVRGYQNQRDHRGPGDHPVVLRRFSARAGRGCGVRGADPLVGGGAGMSSPERAVSGRGGL